jgi:transposase
VRVSRDADAYSKAVRNLGWRVFVCSDPALSLEEAVLAYREEYIIERGFNRLRGKKLGLTPLFLCSTTRIKGLIRLLSIALRVLCLVEFAVREALQKQDEKLSGIYAGNPKRATAKPTTEMMLKVFRGITLTLVNFKEVDQCFITPLNAVQKRILALLGFPISCYQEIEIQFMESAVKMSEQ